MSGIFKFKQFNVDQTGCAMKINTDGVLLGALAEANEPKTILDIGTGTGVIALMLAQRFTSAQIDAVEVDGVATLTAERNFKNSTFSNRLSVYLLTIQDFFKKNPDKKYDLIVSNPPFHLNSLQSPEAKRSIAKHTGDSFFEELTTGVAKHLADDGQCWLVLPLQASELVKKIIISRGLYLQKIITIHSFEYSPAHREILVLGLKNIKCNDGQFIIYDGPNVHSAMYIDLLKDLFTIF